MLCDALGTVIQRPALLCTAMRRSAMLCNARRSCVSRFTRVVQRNACQAMRSGMPCNQEALHRVQWLLCGEAATQVSAEQRKARRSRLHRRGGFAAARALGKNSCLGL
jgi:hypothetical protein